MGKRKCVFLITAVNASLEGINDCMPVVRWRREEQEAWVRDSGRATEILYCVPPELGKVDEG